MRATAAVFEKLHTPLGVAEVDVASPGPGEALVQVVAAGVCHTDALAMEGDMPFPAPGVLGHEGAGIVAAVGPGVSNVSVGDQVVIGWPWCGSCRNCLDGQPRYCLQLGPLVIAGGRPDGSTALRRLDGSPLHSHFFGQSSFATYSLCAANALVPVPADAPVAMLGPLACGIGTGAGAVLNVLRPHPGSSLVVYGAGAVGLSAVMAARLTAATTIIAVDRLPSRLALARELGATETIDVSAAGADPVGAVHEICGEPADYSMDCAGSVSVLRQAADSVGMRGTVALIGGAPAGASFSLDHMSTLWGKRVVGILGGESRSVSLIGTLITLNRQGRFPYDKLITEFPLEQVNEALAASHAGDVIKPVLRMPVLPDLPTRDNRMQRRRRAVYVESVSSADGQDYRDLARSLVGLLDVARRVLSDEQEPSELAARVTGHLGRELSEVVAVHERFQIWDHVNVQRGVDAYLASHGSAGTWFGATTGMMRPHQDLLSRLAMPGSAAVSKAGSASYGTAPTGPDTDTEVVTLGLIATTAPGGEPVVIGLRAEREFGPPHGVLEILAADRAAASATRTEIARLSVEHNVFRGQVLSFGQSEHHGNELVSFLPRIPLAPDDVVLPPGVLDTIERHVAGVGGLSAELRDAGQHLKRGLLLYGPPGTGKTHTVRYLAGKLTGTTVILLTGRSIQFVDSAATLARSLQPSMVVLEDVDLIAMDRDFSENSNPLLFTLLDAMDGVGADADVTFVLTTNRADVLERALADRPGRVDLAVEIPRPDAVCRQRLIRLYARDVAFDGDASSVVAATEGVTASYIKELVRRAVLAALRAGDRPPALRQAHFDEVLAEMNAEHQSLTRSLLGADTLAGEPRPMAAIRRPRR